MKIVAVSDTHGDARILAEIAKREQDADYFLYAGDSELQATNPLFETFQAVRGNMDFDSDFPLTRTIETPEGKIFLAHGHKFGVNFHLDSLAAAAAEAGARLAVYGHTHQLAVSRHAGILTLNPGSISQPRGEFASLLGTYAVITMTGETTTVQYKKRDGSAVERLHFTF